MKVNGTKYQVPFVLVVGKSEDADLAFGEVHSVLVHGQLVLFEYHLLEAQFYPHYHLYALSLTPLSDRQSYLIKHRDLLNYHPYGLYHNASISADHSLRYTVLRSNIC